VDRGKDHDEVGGLDVVLAVAPRVITDQDVVELLQRLAAGDHVDDVDADLDNKLLRHDDPQAQLLAKGMLTKLVVPVEPLAWYHLVHLNHLPQRIERDDP